MMYKIIRPIGDNGGFGQVYQSTDENGNIFALKKLKRNDEFSVSRFEREVRLMSRLNHPNVIRLVTYNLSCKEKFYIMPLYQCSLSSIIPTMVGDYRRQFIIINSILAGVQYLHSEGVLHRDLKPDNILYNSDTDLVITDFGLGIQSDSKSATLTKYTVFGTERYCSPEQKIDSHNVDERTDIYAIGKIIEDIVSNFCTVNTYDNSIDFLIDKCTKKNKEDRFNSIQELSKYVNYVYNSLMGLTESQNLDSDLLRLATGTLQQSEISSVALRVQSSNDSLMLEKFFDNINSSMYQYFESINQELAHTMINDLCKYWNQGGWPFSYIDDITNVAEKIFMASNNAEIKADLLYLMIDLAIYYNRWYAMGRAEELLQSIKNDIATQTALVYKMNNGWVRIERVVDSITSLPALVLDAYREHEKQEDQDIFF